MSDNGSGTTRRHFLAMAGGALLAAGCTKSGPSEPTTTRKGPGVLGVALLGLGEYAADRLAPGLTRTKNCALRGLVTGSPHKLPSWQKKYGIADANVYSYESFPRIADNREIDVVYVVTPTATHMKFALMAAAAGKHVWCEKPMAMDVDECQAIIDACRKNGVSLSIGYRMHHEPNTQTVTGFGKTRPYGAVRSARALVGDPASDEGTWRQVRALGGGALYDLGVYCVNGLRYGTGEEPVRVLRARQWTDRPELFREVDEHAEFELQLSSGATVYGKASRGERMNQLRVECERGWYELSPMQSYSGVKGETSDGKPLDQPIDHQQAKQMDDDALAILERRPPSVPGEEGRRDIQIINAIQKCAASGAAVDI